jgi:hypothetical protein
MYKFCEYVIAVFNKVYLREPNVDDTVRLWSINETGFPGMIGSIDSIYWERKNDNIEGMQRGVMSFLSCCI